MPAGNDRLYTVHAAVCKALGHPARLRVLDLLRDGEECVCRLAPQVGVTDSHLSQLLGVLRRAGLVEARRDGHAIFYRVSDERVFEVMDRMCEVLAERLARAGELAISAQV